MSVCLSPLWLYLSCIGKKLVLWHLTWVGVGLLVSSAGCTHQPCWQPLSLTDSLPRKHKPLDKHQLFDNITHYTHVHCAHVNTALGTLMRQHTRFHTRRHDKEINLISNLISNLCWNSFVTIKPYCCVRCRESSSQSCKTGNDFDVWLLSESWSTKILFPLQQINSTERSRGAVNPDPWLCCAHWWYSEGLTWLSGRCDTSIPDRQPFWGQNFCVINCSREEKWDSQGRAITPGSPVYPLAKSV